MGKPCDFNAVKALSPSGDSKLGYSSSPSVVEMQEFFIGEERADTPSKVIRITSDAKAIWRTPEIYSSELKSSGVKSWNCPFNCGTVVTVESVE